MKARKCLGSTTVLKHCLLIAYVSSTEIGVHANQENQPANLVVTLFQIFPSILWKKYGFN